MALQLGGGARVVRSLAQADILTKPTQQQIGGVIGRTTAVVLLNVGALT